MSRSGGDPSRLYGKYRGVVADNVDLQRLARLLVSVPAVPGMKLNWAMPCVPYAGEDVGFFALPPIGAKVWVEFEGGNPHYPIWSGCFWDEDELPTDIYEANPIDPSLVKVFKTPGISLVVNDTPGEGGFTLTVEDPVVEVPMSMKVDSEGITLSCPPSTIRMVPDVGITLETPVSTVSLTEETITVNNADSTVLVTAENVTVESAESTATVTAEAIVVEAPDVNVTGVVSVEGDSNIVGAFEVEGAVDLVGEVNIAPLLTVEGGIVEDGVPIVPFP